MIDFAKYDVKTLAENGVEFHFTDIKTKEQVPTKLIVYGADSDAIRKARKEFNDITDNANVSEAKKDLAMRKFLASCVKSWEDEGENALAFNGKIIKSGDVDGFAEMLMYAKQYQKQLLEFVTEHTNFLAD
jgi:hypothetical protein